MAKWIFTFFKWILRVLKEAGFSRALIAPEPAIQLFQLDFPLFERSRLFGQVQRAKSFLIELTL